MDKVDKLLAAMTVEEKIGQLHMAAAGFAVTGPVLANKATEDIRAGHIGSLLSPWGLGTGTRAGQSGEEVRDKPVKR
jgi:beta-glucosidase